LIFIGGNNFGVNGWEPVIYLSSNGGLNWTNTYMGSPDNFYSIRFLFIDPNSNDEVIYAGYKSEVQGGFLKSTDGGFTWVEIGGTIPVTYKWGGAIVCSPDNSDKLLAGCGGYGHAGTICISEDAGESWVTTSLNLGIYSKISDILIHPELPDVIYCSSTQNGVQISTNGGISWTPANEGLAATNVTGFSNPYPDQGVWSCYASTFSNSAYFTDLFDPSIGLDESGTTQKLQIYPNPSDGIFTVKLSGDEEIRKLEVVTITGQPVAFREKETVPGANLWIMVQAAPGVYLVKVHLGKNILIEKVVIR
ncbi:MAG: T9SS type A sorting domain-containing protein, partial [Bacteroidota bacterium]